MPSPRLPLALLLLGCPAGPERGPALQQPPDAGVADHREPAPDDDLPPPNQPATPATRSPEKPAFSAPRADGSLADTLPPPAPLSGLPGGCEGGTRRAGETWKVDCNECSCGDDGQSTCTAMACLPRPVR